MFEMIKQENKAEKSSELSRSIYPALSRDSGFMALGTPEKKNGLLVLSNWLLGFRPPEKKNMMVIIHSYSYQYNTIGNMKIFSSSLLLGQCL